MREGKQKNKYRVVLFDDQPERLSRQNTMLDEAGCDIVVSVVNESNLLPAVKKNNPEVILICSEKPRKSMIKVLANLQASFPKPIVMFSLDDESETIKQAAAAGVSSYLVGDIQVDRIGSIIDVAIIRFEHSQQLKLKLKKVESQLSERKILDKAKGLLMAQHNITEEEAYGMMRKLAMDNSCKISQIAQDIILVK